MKESLQHVAKWLNSKQQFAEDILVTGVSINTLTLQAGDLFIPFKGEKTNGHQYVQKAFELGASAALWQTDEGEPPADLPIIVVENTEKALQQMAKAYRAEHGATFIGITGSNGKTSTKDFVAGVLSPYFRVQKTIGNYNNQLGLPLTILGLHKHTEVAVLEMGMSNFGEISFLSNLAEPHLVAITNIGEAHMQDLGSREGIAKAKFEIVDGLQPSGTLLYDGDEPLLKPFVDSFLTNPTLAIGYDATNTLYPTSIVATDRGSEFHVSGLVEGTFQLPVYGKHQVKNALFAVAIADKLGLTADQIARGFLNVSLTDMRMQPMISSTGALFINDAYNAAPTSMKAAIDFVASSNLRNEKWLVLGDMLELGEDETAFHGELASSIAPETIDQVLLLGPRMKHLFTKLAPTFGERVRWFEEDKKAMAKILKEETSDQSMVIFKGSRGMALEEIIEQIEA
ncbi:UDP-N-acetylmuramoyl-tripeptide--D-alanyl-D-alanine ligase [Paenisporosarcina cavernae]|uniref:UDP-N-acetylmuramoyl-tripeptide--D-alanyl-D-alanine ligase n=1 Tax=Paenisporosarcina cavernae TaxID=2320858 RepID=A0A385YY36_9BACL|nr:UDP-N-acetylmuramoyl-tripeptide--D-alanyl-D-alanine ligase [Paenisporosarcina cavernae]AYC30372.1 UDP-N-acetylmuramoyl-tripeptide--D-alanyl-D-alanine ligase [Paenisporosarcina cavernae]